MELIDTHCHLYLAPLNHDVESVRKRAADAGIRDIVVPAFGLTSWNTVQELSRLEGVHPALGLHPWFGNQVAPQEVSSTQRNSAFLRGKRGQSSRANQSSTVGAVGPIGPTIDDGDLAIPQDTLESMTIAEFRDRLASAIEACGAVAIGEIGLDFMIEQPTVEHQVAILRTQLALASDYDLPVILHCCNGWELLVGALQAHAGRIRGVLHAYTRHTELARSFLRCGFYIGFGGTLTRPEAKRTRGSAASLPLDRIILETDAPSTGLDGVDPRQTEPRHLLQVAEALAEARDMPVQEVAEITSNNARELFRI